MGYEFVEDRFSTAEAAVLLQESRTRVQKWLSSGPVEIRLEKQGDREYRFLGGSDLVYLAFLRRLLIDVKQLYPATKKKLHEAVLQFVISPGDELPVSECMAIRQASVTLLDLQNRILKLRRARDMVVSDPEIRGGEPVIQGTRIPVHSIVDMLRQGASEEEVLQGYPSLDAEQLELAQIYAAAYKKQGRPNKHPWHSGS